MDNIDPPFIKNKNNNKKSESESESELTISKSKSASKSPTTSMTDKIKKSDYIIDNNDNNDNEIKRDPARPFRVGDRDLNPLSSPSSSSKNGNDIESGGMIVGPDHPGFFPSFTFTPHHSHSRERNNNNRDEGDRDEDDETGDNYDNYDNYGRLRSLVPPGARYDPISPIYPGEPDSDELLPPRGAGYYPSSDDGPSSSPFAIRPQRLPGSIKDPSNKPPFFHGPNPFDKNGKGNGKGGMGGMGDMPPFFK